MVLWMWPIPSLYYRYMYMSIISYKWYKFSHVQYNTSSLIIFAMNRTLQMMLLTGEKYYYECKKNECARLHDASCSMLVKVQKVNLQSSKGGILTVYCLTVKLIQTVNYVMLKKHLVKSSNIFWHDILLLGEVQGCIIVLRYWGHFQNSNFLVRLRVGYPSDNVTPLYCSLKFITTSVGVKIILSTTHKNWLISEWQGYSI